MGDHHYIMVELEDAERQKRFCHCGKYMTPAADQDGIWFQCRTIGDEKRNRITRVLDFLVPHDRRLIADLEELAPTEVVAPSIAAAGRTAAALRAERQAA